MGSFFPGETALPNTYILVDKKHRPDMKKQAVFQGYFGRNLFFQELVKPML